MNFDYHAVASAATAAIPLAAGAAGVGYFILRQKGFGFGTSHLLEEKTTLMLLHMMLELMTMSLNLSNLKYLSLK